MHQFPHERRWFSIGRSARDSELLRELDGLKRVFGDAFDPAQYRMLAVGMAMVVVMNWRPRGLIAIRKPSIFLLEEKPVTGALAEEDHG